MSPGEEASFSISVYSEHPFEFASFEGAGEFPLCTTCQSLCPQVRPNLRAAAPDRRSHCRFRTQLIPLWCMSGLPPDRAPSRPPTARSLRTRARLARPPRPLSPPLPQLGSASGGPLDLLLERLGEIEGRFVKLEKTRYWEKIPQLKVGSSGALGLSRGRVGRAAGPLALVRRRLRGLGASVVAEAAHNLRSPPTPRALLPCRAPALRAGGRHPARGGVRRQAQARCQQDARRRDRRGRGGQGSGRRGQ